MAQCSCGADNTVELSYTDRMYCDECFEQYIEKRVRKRIRLEKDIEPRDTVFVYDDGSKEFEVAKRFLQRVFEENITVKTTEDKDVDRKVVYPTNLDRYVSERLREFLNNTYKPRSDTTLLDNVLEEEIVALCNCWDIPAKQDEEVNMLIERMEDKYPDAKFSLRSAFDKIDEQSSS